MYLLHLYPHLSTGGGLAYIVLFSSSQQPCEVPPSLPPSKRPQVAWVPLIPGLNTRDIAIFSYAQKGVQEAAILPSGRGKFQCISLCLLIETYTNLILPVVKHYR